MCDLPTALAVIGTAFSAVGAIQQGQAAASTADYNARVATQNAAYEERIQREKAQRLMAQQSSGYLKAGVAMSGTPLDVLADTAAQAELDALAIRYGGATQAAGYRAQGAAAKTAGYIGTGTTLLTGASSWGKDLFPTAPAPTGNGRMAGPV
jgi:hypothetical protein